MQAGIDTHFTTRPSLARIITVVYPTPIGAGATGYGRGLLVEKKNLDSSRAEKKDAEKKIISNPVLLRSFAKK